MAIIDRYAGLVIDLDGVIVRGDLPLPAAVTFLKKSRRSKVPVVFVTNNSSRTPQEWSTLFADAKADLDPARVITSGASAAALLAGSAGSAVFVIGNEPLRQQLQSAGLQVTDVPDEAEVVVVGADRSLNYDRLARASRAISRGARFVGTNPDVVRPTQDGDEPGNGATLAFLQAATGVAPEVVGKPQTPMFELAAQQLGVEGPILVVGDQVDTDVVAASRMGWDSALVLSGVADWQHLIGARAMPTWVIRDIGELLGPEPAVVRHAREADLSAIMKLVEAAGFWTEGAAARLRQTLVAEDPGGEVVGTVSWELVDNAAHVRALTVAERERGHGTGAHLVVAALDELQRAGVDWIYMITPASGALLEKLGFWQVSRDRVPPEIIERSQFGPEASGGLAMVRRI